MNYDHYNEMAGRICRHPFLLNILLLMNHLLTLAAFLLYPTLLLIHLLRRDTQAIGFLLVPGISFFAVSAIRKKINAPRPYELFAIRPLILKNKRGESFPSRHIFSIFLIGVLWISLSPPIGFFLLAAGTGLAAVRVLGGVHFVRDVLAGALTGILCGLATLWVSPLIG